MGLKKYIFGSFLLIIVVFGYIFSIESGDYRLVILDNAIVLPIAIWIVAPLVLLFIVSLLHIIFYGLKNYFAVKSITKDSASIVTVVSKGLLNDKSSVICKNKELQELVNILGQLNIDIKDTDFKSSNKTIEKIVKQLFDIQNGKYIAGLKIDSSSKYNTMNLKNRINDDEGFALEAVKQSSTYPFEVKSFAFDKIIETKSMTTIKKIIDDIEFDIDMLIALIKKDSTVHNEFSLTNDIILKLIKQVEPSNKQLIEISQYYKKTMSPDQIIKLYENITTFKEEYTSSYLYVLAQYEMLDTIRDILLNSNSNEYLAFRAIIDLRDAGKHTYCLDTLCYK